MLMVQENKKKIILLFIFILTCILYKGIFYSAFFQCQKTCKNELDRNEETPKKECSFEIEYFGEKSFVKTYENSVDLRVIVITYNRPKNLERALKSIENIVMDGDKISVEIWIDRNKKTGKPDSATIELVKNFTNITHSKFNVHIHDKPVGLYGQWLLTYCPDDEKLSNGKEKVLFLEDDQIVSKYSYRWLKAVHETYENNDDYIGCTLRSFETFPIKDKPSKDHPIFEHRIFSTHSFMPKLSVWRSFLKWATKHINRSDFKPYVPNILPTQWYQTFEKQKTTHNMWSMWFLYYTYSEQLFTIYPNTLSYPLFQKDKTKYCFNIDTRAAGLHSGGEIVNYPCKLISTWNDDFIKFKDNLHKIDWQGNSINRTVQK